MLMMHTCFENKARGASQLMLMMRTCCGNGARGASQLMLMMHMRFENGVRGASQLMLMTRALGMGPGSLPADAHDAHVLWGWGQGASQLMPMMRTCFGDGVREPPSWCS